MRPEIYGSRIQETATDFSPNGNNELFLRAAALSAAARARRRMLGLAADGGHAGSAPAHLPLTDPHRSAGASGGWDLSYVQTAEEDQGCDVVASPPLVHSFR